MHFVFTNLSFVFSEYISGCILRLPYNSTMIHNSDNKILVILLLVLLLPIYSFLHFHYKFYWILNLHLIHIKFLLLILHLINIKFLLLISFCATLLIITRVTILRGRSLAQCAACGGKTITSAKTFFECIFAYNHAAKPIEHVQILNRTEASICVGALYSQEARHECCSRSTPRSCIGSPGVPDICRFSSGATGQSTRESCQYTAAVWKLRLSCPKKNLFEEIFEETKQIN